MDESNKEEELQILKRMSFTNKQIDVREIITAKDLLKARSVVDEVYLDEKIERYILRLVAATRDPSLYGMAELKPYIRFGASPRASIYLALAARGHALIRSGEFVIPDDVKAVLLISAIIGRNL